MDNTTSTSTTHWWKNTGSYRFPRRYKLRTEEQTQKSSMNAVLFAILASAINTKMLNPNFPIMVSPGLHPDSFPDTNPFEFNSATYFVPMCSLLGVAIASVFIGSISDRFGRKVVLQTLGVVSGIGSIVKYFCRQTFWGFCISSLVFGFFLGNLPVGMAYIGDVYSTNKKKKEDALGVLVAAYVMGNSGGGILAILMEDSGLFAPLWVGAALMFVSVMATARYMIEYGQQKEVLDIYGESSQPLKVVENGDDDDDENDMKRPTEIDQVALWNVVIGALADNIGSTGLMPLCLSPLALEQYLADFVNAGEDPIMTLTGYKWLSVMVALMVVPSTMITPTVFAKIGAAGTCVFGNVCTAVVTMALLFIGNGPATTAAFAGFVVVLYGGFPFTVFSQLTTGPMLDVLAPEDKLGYVQGLNNSAMNFGMAFAPWLLGLLADATSTNTAIWTGVGISLAAAAINFPLTFRKEMGRQVKKPPVSKRILSGEDEELVQKVLDGEFVDPEALFLVNQARSLANKSIIIPAVKPYQEDRESLGELYAHAEANLRFRKSLHDRILAEVDSPQRQRETQELCDLLNRGEVGNEEEINTATADVGKWVADYLRDNGYRPQFNSVLIKQMVLSAFPSITRDKEFTPSNIETALLRSRQVMSKYLELQEQQKYSWNKLVGNGSTGYVGYS